MGSKAIPSCTAFRFREDNSLPSFNRQEDKQSAPGGFCEPWALTALIHGEALFCHPLSSPRQPLTFW